MKYIFLFTQLCLTAQEQLTSWWTNNDERLHSNGWGLSLWTVFCVHCGGVIVIYFSFASSLAQSTDLQKHTSTTRVKSN